MEIQSSTLFVRSLPYDTTNETLETAFSEIGPIKKCFVVKDKGADKCKGFGYVQFVTREDATRAKEDILKVGNRRVDIAYANKKPKVPKTGKSDTKVTEKPKLVENIKQVEKRQEERTQQKTVKSEKKFRLIVRNLSFKAQDTDLTSSFQSFGKLLDVTIPKNPDGKSRGFGFVQFETSNSAIKAMKLNGSKIKGRQIVLDWAVAKDRYDLSQSASMEEKSITDKHSKIKSNKATDTKGTSSSRTDDSSSDDDDDDNDDDDDDDDDRNQNEQDTVDEYDSDRGYDDSDANSDFESEQNVAQHKQSINNRKSPNGTHSSVKQSLDIKERDSADSFENESDDSEDESENDSESTDGDSEMSDNDSEDSETSNEEKVNAKKKPRQKPSDVEEGRTLFIRNLPYECADEDVLEEFSRFGKLNYAAVVMDNKTAHSRGTAFVQFRKKEDADKCVKSSSNEAISVMGRQLLVTMAVNKSNAAKLCKEKKEVATEKDQSGGRNLWLAREGLIRQGSQAAEGLSKTDLVKRMKLESAKRQKLKKPNMFVSTTRLSVHNLPLSVTDSQLKVAILKVLDDKSARIDECRIMRDLDKLIGGDKKGKSRGYAFVNFTQHVHALKALRLLNNSTEIFGDKRRPIVEFSLENQLALAAKERRNERSKLKDVVLKSGNKKGIYTGLQKKKKEKKSTDDPTVAKRPENMPKGMKALPSHWGPKIRHKGNAQPVKSKKRKESNQQVQPPEKKQKLQNQAKRREKTDDLDKLVNKYRKTLAGKVGKSETKWFES